MKKIKNLRGELTTQQIVLLIILITSFAIILFFFFRLNLGEETQKEICHNSVILKGKSIPSLGGGNLDCKTNYLCISSGGDCEEINPTQTIKINLNDKDEILKAIADEMVSCWWMFGEGKVDYGGGFTSTTVSCAVCSILKFDKKIHEEFPKITYIELYNYLNKNKKDNSQTYLKYLYGINDVSSFESRPQFAIDINEDVISTNERYSVITGIDNNFIEEDKILKTYLISSKDTSTKTQCGEFITKA